MKNKKLLATKPMLNEVGGAVEWISVNKKIPDNYHFVIMAINDKVKYASFVGYYDDGRWWFANEEPADNVTYWAALPKPPKV